MEEEEAHTLLLTDKKDNPASTDTANGVKSNVSWPTSEERNSLLDIPSKDFSPKKSLIQHSDGAGNTLYIQEITDEESGKELVKLTDNSNGKERQKNNTKNKLRKHTKSLKSSLSRFYNFMDLDLLRDGVYLNILYSQSMLVVVEVNFKLILPFFLSDLGFTHSETASVLSSMAVSDICCRLIVPPILDRVAVSRRATFIFGSICVALGRSCLALQRSLGQIIITLVIIGFFRGISLTSYPLVLTEYSSGNNFPSVLGLCMVSNGISIVILGPVSGYIRDVTNSYPLFIHCQTVLMISVLIAWIVEIIILKSRKNKQADLDVLDRETEDKITVTKV
ncbi:unnamed protein product [Nezara viridula]|uniref:Uncharacterized protein n=1 Tax=Nezara viridula TaxID=85310 RepID=A0A9P0HDK5_NEZVI|nr:unnamed protein product [Nezara viridula]